MLRVVPTPAVVQPVLVLAADLIGSIFLIKFTLITMDDGGEGLDIAADMLKKYFSRRIFSEKLEIV